MEVRLLQITQNLLMTWSSKTPSSELLTLLQVSVVDFEKETPKTVAAIVYLLIWKLGHVLGSGLPILVEAPEIVFPVELVILT